MNVRDLGGLPLGGGGSTAYGRILRADNLQGLSDADVALLTGELGLRTVVDLRTTPELESEGPGPLTREPHVTIHHCSLYPEAGAMTDVDAGVGSGAVPWWNRDAEARETGETPAVTAYLGYLRDRPDSIVAALRALAAPDGAALVHCAAGKDRTGVVVMFALELAGVAREEIVADYVATGDRIEQISARLLASPTYAPDLEGHPASAHMPHAHTIERLLELLDDRHGSPLEWLRSHGFGDDDVAALRDRLTAS